MMLNFLLVKTPSDVFSLLNGVSHSANFVVLVPTEFFKFIDNIFLFLSNRIVFFQRNFAFVQLAFFQFVFEDGHDCACSTYFSSWLK